MPAPSVSMFPGPPAEGYTIMASFDATPSLEYIGLAKSMQPPEVGLITAASNASPCVLTKVGHGLQTGNRVTIAGATGAWAPINGSHVVTYVSADTYSIAVDSTTFGTFVGQVVTASTTAPRLTAAIWSICRNFYDTTKLVRTAWAEGTPAENRIWNSRTTYAYM